MARDAAEQKKKESQIEERLMSLEWKALSVVLDNWSKTGIIKKGKLLAFRDAMMVGLNHGAKDAIPYEIVEDEYLVMLDALNSISATKNMLSGVEHKIDSRKRKTFFRPFPCSPENLKGVSIQFMSGHKKEVIARRLVNKRIGVSENTVKNSLRHKEPRRYVSTPVQRLLISLFLDVVAPPDTPERVNLQITILDALIATNLAPIAIYYVIQASHDIKKPISLTVKAHDIHQLCNEICSKSTLRKGIFTQWASGKKNYQA
jgi:hypothetical protein